VLEKNELLKSWHEQCEKNFLKSLDHRSFHFKQFEKKHQQAKAYVNDIKAASQRSARLKGRLEAVGGSRDCEFFCTYSQFEHVVVHPEEAMRTVEIQKDFPINMKKIEEIGEVQDKLP